MFSKHKTIPFIVLVIVVTVISLGLHLYAANTLPVGPDEPLYLEVALNYNNDIRHGHINQIWWDTLNYEHPIFDKLVYGVALFLEPPLDQLNHKDIPQDVPMTAEIGARPWAMADRMTSVMFNTITVLVLATLDPLAALFVGTDTLNVNFTSRVTLEALPMLTSLLSALFYLNWKKRHTSNINPKNRWGLLILSAFCLGITAASKYIYCIVGLAIVTDYVLHYRREKQLTRNLFILLMWGGIALLTFFIFDPILWPHPYQRLMDSITFHYNYSADHAACCDYPFWQGFTWLSSPYSHFFQATKASFLVHPDTLIFILGILGLPWLYKKERFWAIWFFESGLFLLLWQVKWPQYSLVILIPLCFSAAEVVIQGIHLTIEKGSLFFQSKPLSTLIKHHRYH